MKKIFCILILSMVSMACNRITEEPEAGQEETATNEKFKRDSIANGQILEAVDPKDIVPPRR